ncbi:hypothetical protein [Methylomonas sp. AM2-LC]|uniref:hypothetical protein n=1 Tax=Methylomonas sp. AM2-LC TaxID=3153301 RepID=UPI0032656AA6
MNIKNLMLITVLSLTAATAVAKDTNNLAIQKSSGGLPASPLQYQILGPKPNKPAEFARFEAVPVRYTKANTYQGNAISPNQLEVLGKKVK